MLLSCYSLLVLLSCYSLLVLLSCYSLLVLLSCYSLLVLLSCYSLFVHLFMLQPVGVTVMQQPVIMYSIVTQCIGRSIAAQYMQAHRPNPNMPICLTQFSVSHAAQPDLLQPLQPLPPSSKQPPRVRPSLFDVLPGSIAKGGAASRLQQPSISCSGSSSSWQGGGAIPVASSPRGGGGGAGCSRGGAGCSTGGATAGVGGGYSPRGLRGGVSRPEPAVAGAGAGARLQPPQLLEGLSEV